MKVKNLQKLASYLLNDSLKAEFDMRFFSKSGYVKDVMFYGVAEIDCGSVGCAVGHGPYAGIEKLKYESWSSYSSRVFGLNGDDFDWCFSELWEYVDNSPVGAAKRINILIESGLPFDWALQMKGFNELMYKN